MDKIFEILKYIFLGAVQGITETLPISSSGHLVIMEKILNIKGPEKDLTFEILLHLGSLIAIFYFYRKTIIALIKNFFIYLFKRDETKFNDYKYAWLIVVSTIPAGIVGLLLKDFIAEKLTNLLTVGCALLITALVLFFISKIKKGNKDKTQITFKDAIIIGVVQALAIIPGISRSGSTVSASLYRKFNIDDALRFSFLLFIPAALGAALIDVVKFVNNPNISTLIIPYFLAFLTSIIFTYISLNIFIDIIKRGKLSYFSIYCFIVGTLSIIFYIW